MLLPRPEIVEYEMEGRTMEGLNGVLGTVPKIITGRLNEIKM